MTSAPVAPWNVLIVDDEEDIHGITTIALKRKAWRGRPIALRSARSGTEARELLLAPDAPKFHCALVDVVMETNDAGLQLCDFIRATMPRTMRLILRTGQPGVAPPDKVLNDYDIDYYLAKTDVTDEKLFHALRACFRSSLDISALMAVSAQLRALTAALQSPTATKDALVAIMVESLRFVEEKYDAELAFVPDVRVATMGLPSVDAGAVAAALAKANREKLAPMEIHSAEPLGLPAGSFLVLTTTLNTMSRAEKSISERMKNWFKSVMSESGDDEEQIVAGIVGQFRKEQSDRIRGEFAQDLELFLANWKMADGSFRLQDKLVRDRMEMMKQYGQGV